VTREHPRAASLATGIIDPVSGRSFPAWPAWWPLCSLAERDAVVTAGGERSYG